MQFLGEDRRRAVPHDDIGKVTSHEGFTDRTVKRPGGVGIDLPAEVDSRGHDTVSIGLQQVEPDFIPLVSHQLFADTVVTVPDLVSAQADVADNGLEPGFGDIKGVETYVIGARAGFYPYPDVPGGLHVKLGLGIWPAIDRGTAGQHGLYAAITNLGVFNYPQGTELRPFGHLPERIPGTGVTTVYVGTFQLGTGFPLIMADPAVIPQGVGGIVHGSQTELQVGKGADRNSTLLHDSQSIENWSAAGVSSQTGVTGHIHSLGGRHDGFADIAYLG